MPLRDWLNVGRATICPMPVRGRESAHEDEEEKGEGHTLVEHDGELVVSNNPLPQLLLLTLARNRAPLGGRRVPERPAEVPLALIVRPQSVPHSNRELARDRRAVLDAHVLPHQLDVPSAQLVTRALANHVHALPEALEEPPVQTPEGVELARDDVLDLLWVLADGHAEVAAVREARDGLEELALREGLGEEEERGAHGGGEVDLVREADPGVVVEDLDLFWERRRSEREDARDGKGKRRTGF